VDETLVQGLVEDANQMYALLTPYQVLRREGYGDALVRCATIGCRLLRDKALVQALVDGTRTFQEMAVAHRAEMQELVGVEHFELLLRTETYLLDRAGIDRSLIAVIVRYCREAREGARQGELDADTFRAALEKLGNQVCKLLEPSVTRGGGNRESRHRSRADHARLRAKHADQVAATQLQACLKGVCGCVIVGLDASTLAATVGLSAAGSAVSIALGGAIVGQAITELLAAQRHGRIWLAAWYRLRNRRPV
jgi:hypothetical protein